MMELHRSSTPVKQDEVAGYGTISIVMRQGYFVEDGSIDLFIEDRV